MGYNIPLRHHFFCTGGLAAVCALTAGASITVIICSACPQAFEHISQVVHVHLGEHPISASVSWQKNFWGFLTFLLVSGSREARKLESWKGPIRQWLTMAENLYLFNYKVCVMNFCASSKKFSMYLVRIIYKQWRSSVCHVTDGYHLSGSPRTKFDLTCWKIDPIFLASHLSSFFATFLTFFGNFPPWATHRKFLSESWCTGLQIHTRYQPFSDCWSEMTSMTRQYQQVVTESIVIQS